MALVRREVGFMSNGSKGGNGQSKGGTHSGGSPIRTSDTKGSSTGNTGHK